jgi:HEAT repeat protein
MVDVLVSIGDPVVPHAIRLLADQRWFVVRNMVVILGGVGTPGAVKALLRLRRDPDSRIRKEIARALGRAANTAGEDAEQELLNYLGDPDPAVRLVAVSSAASLRSERVLQTLWRIFQRIRIRSKGWEFKNAILLAIGRIGLEEGVECLSSVAKKRPLFWRRRWEILQQTAVQALGDLGGEKPQTLLLGLREHKNPEVRRAAIRALAAIPEHKPGATA